MSIIIFLIILLILVLVHEFGHFFVAKRFGIRVDEFGFGFPPKLWGRKRGETEYSINLLPLGGFVKIFGETPDEESMHGPDRERSFIHKPKWQQALVLFAGVFMNFLLAWVLFSFGFMSGLPTSVSSNAQVPLEDVSLVILDVAPGSPAEKAGLQPGDIIYNIRSGQKTTRSVDPEILKSFVMESRGEAIEIDYFRSPQKDYNYKTAEITPLKNGEEWVIGISMDEIGIAKMSVLGAFREGMKLTLEVVKETTLGLYKLVKEGLLGRGSLASVTGPVGLVGFVGDAYKFGFAYLMSFAALISINLAIINLIPFPALDGGRLLFLLIEKIKGSSIKPSVANAANSIGFAILILLMLLVTYHDITKLL